MTPSSELDADAVLLDMELYTEAHTVGWPGWGYLLLVFIILFLYAGFYVRSVIFDPKASLSFTKTADIEPELDPDNPEISVTAVLNEKWRQRSIEQVILKLGQSAF